MGQTSGLPVGRPLDARFNSETGGFGAVQNAQAAVATLAAHDIPHLIVGGVAVQEHCYPRVTAGKVLKRGCRVPFPTPTRATEALQIVKLEELVSLKLDSSAHSPPRRLRDKPDVVELILRRKLPRDLAVARAVRPRYLETWDALQAEG